MKPNYRPALHWMKHREKARFKHDRNGPTSRVAIDPIIAKYRFCNVRREDDRVTKWIKENIRVPYQDSPHLWFMLCIARQINWPPALNALIKAQGYTWPQDDTWDSRAFARVLDRMATEGEKVFTGAYIITAGPKKGESKPKFLARMTLGAPWKQRHNIERYLDGREPPTMQGMHSLLISFTGWGPFLAYQAVVDMRFTPILNTARDKWTWAAAGPGTIRGLNRLHHRPTDARLSQRQALAEMMTMALWLRGSTDIAFDFSDVPNILCETDKYLRVKNGEGKPRALYVPGRGA